MNGLHPVSYTHLDVYKRQLVAMTRGEQISKLVYDEQHNLVSWNENGKTLRRWDYDHRGQMCIRDRYKPIIPPQTSEKKC